MKRLFLMCLILCLVAVSTGCKQAFSTTEDNKQDVSVTDSEIKKTYFSADWNQYNSAQELTQNATHIFEGKVTRIFFEALDIRTLHPPKTEGENEYVRLYTVYEVKVTAEHKGDVAETEYICKIGGLETMLAEQKQVMEEAGIYDSEMGLLLLTNDNPLSVGSSYFFSVIDKGVKYKVIINPSQFAMALNEKDTQHRVTPDQIKEYLKNNPKE